MPSGGHAHSGPAPDPNALRRLRKDDAGWTTLPTERDKPAPDWPLVEPSSRELELWESWWAKPQALVWERSASSEYVAFTVRMFAEAEQPKARTEDRKSLNQMMANLYLTPDSLARARLKIAADDTAEKREEKSGARVRQASTRDRFTVVSGAGGA